MFGRESQEAFAPLMEMWQKGGPERVELEFYGGSGLVEKTLIDSSDPRVLDRISRSIEGLTRLVCLRGAAYGCGVTGKLTLHGSGKRILIGITDAGFCVGSEAAVDWRLFYSHWLAAAIDELYFARTGHHLEKVFIDEWSYSGSGAPIEGEESEAVP